MRTYINLPSTHEDAKEAAAEMLECLKVAGKTRQEVVAKLSATQTLIDWLHARLYELRE